MTFREKLAMEHPDSVGPDYTGGCEDCPHDWGYESAEESTNNCEENCGKGCEYCWNREMPKTEKRSGRYPCGVENAFKSTGEAVKKTTASIKELNESLEPHILDSGDRTQFETGAVRDMREGKGRCDLLPLDVVVRYLELFINHNSASVLIPITNFLEDGDYNHLYESVYIFALKVEAFGMSHPTMLLEVAKHFEEGAKKYGDNNWRKGIPVKCYIDSAIRHYLKYLRGDKDEPHDRAFCWNILCAIWTCKHMPELNDYRKEEEKNE